jgi:bacillithiol biosynthesis deacetylase BshB1
MKILAVGAHPDDVEFGCAPLLIQEADRGHEVRVLLTSKGEAASSGTPEERELEAREAGRIIGADVDFLDLGGDCRIQYTAANCVLLARQIRDLRPQIVFAPLTGENQHPDHSIVGRLVRDGARLARYGGLEDLRDQPPHSISSLFYYAITQVFAGPPDVVVDVSAVHARWVEAMQAHKSQMKTRAYVDLVNARARAAGASIGVDYAVGVWANDPICVEAISYLTRSSRFF